MRERTTWNRAEIAKRASTSRTADPYTMNQDHVNQQPKADDYVTGTPSDFAEDVHTPNRWEEEYKGGQVDRNEIGLPEMRSDTFNHSEKTASHEVLLKKADLTVKVARMMLPKTASEAAVEDQAYALMYMPDSELIQTFDRLANEDQGQQEQTQEQTQEQQKQAAQDMVQKQAQEAIQAIQKGDMASAQNMINAMVQHQVKLAQDQAQAQQAQEQEKQAQQQQQQAQQQQQQAQQQQAMAQQLAQLVEQACKQQAQQQQAPVQQQAQQQQAPVQAEQQQAPVQQQAQQQQAPVMSDDQLLDTMLMDEPVVDDMGIEMEAPLMDTGDVVLGPEDDVLRNLFANQEVQDAEEAQQAQQGQKQASTPMTRTASTRTVGTRPTQGVSKIGGVGSNAAVPNRGAEIDKLAALWPSAPDVSSTFGR